MLGSREVHIEPLPHLSQVQLPEGLAARPLDQELDDAVKIEKGLRKSDSAGNEPIFSSQKRGAHSRPCHLIELKLSPFKPE